MVKHKKHKVEVHSWIDGVLQTLHHWAESIEHALELIEHIKIHEIYDNIKVFDDCNILVHEHKHTRHHHHHHHHHNYA